MKIIVYKSKIMCYNLYTIKVAIQSLYTKYNTLIKWGYYMARPMVLMQEDLLNEIWYKHAQGVPVLAVIRQFDLDGKITAPTLTKLLSYVTAMNTESTSPEISELIYNSLFPEWLVASEAIIVSNPPDFYYTGKMPLGKWVKRGTELPKAAPIVKPKAIVKPVKQVKGKANGKR